MNASLGVHFVDYGGLWPSIWECYKFRQLTFTAGCILGCGYFANAHNIFQLMRKLKLKIHIVGLKHAILNPDR